MLITPVHVVLATHNGARWLDKQLESIRAQSFTHWRLLLSDDGSKDGSQAIIDRIQKQDQRIQMLRQRSGECGHVANFEYLLVAAQSEGASLVCLCDQDDVWNPDKLETLKNIMGTAAGGPAAAFSDLDVVTAEGASLGGFIAGQQLNAAPTVANLLQQNSVPGCSLMVNSALLELALPFPPGLRNHDWWLALCAAAVSGLHYTPRRLVAYRQHDSNTIGASGGAYWRQLMPVLYRQQQVFYSKIRAVQVLIQRLQESGRAPPGCLEDFVTAFNDKRGWSLPFNLLQSEFKPRNRALLIAQLVALCPLLTVKGSDKPNS